MFFVPAFITVTVAASSAIVSPLHVISSLAVGQSNQLSVQAAEPTMTLTQLQPAVVLGQSEPMLTVLQPAAPLTLQAQ